MTVTTPPTTTPVPELRTAGVVSRGLAFTIDATIVTLVTAASGVVLQAALKVLLRRTAASDLDLSVVWVFALPVIFGLYCITFWLLAGETPGKALLGLRVVRRDGSPLGAWNAIVRAPAYLISAIFMIGFAWAAVDRRNRGFHDMIAHTLVVYDGERVGAV